MSSMKAIFKSVLAKFSQRNVVAQGGDVSLLGFL
jgi:hypothetical protein